MAVCFRCHRQYKQKSKGEFCRASFGQPRVSERNNRPLQPASRKTKLFALTSPSAIGFEQWNKDTRSAHPDHMISDHVVERSRSFRIINKNGLSLNLTAFLENRCVCIVSANELPPSPRPVRRAIGPHDSRKPAGESGISGLNVPADRRQQAQRRRWFRRNHFSEPRNDPETDARHTGVWAGRWGSIMLTFILNLIYREFLKSSVSGMRFVR
jgi:hypothetical protein